MKKRRFIQVIAMLLCAMLLLSACQESESSGDEKESKSNTYETPVNIMEEQANAKKAPSSPFDQQIEKLNGLCEKELEDLVKIVKKAGYYEDYLDEYKDDFEEQIEDKKDEYGNDYKLAYKITDKEEIDKEELKDFQDEYRNRGEDVIDFVNDLDSDDYEDVVEYMEITESQAKDFFKIVKDIGNELKEIEVTEGYKLTLTATITGSELDEPDEWNPEISVYKVNGRWVTENELLFLANVMY